MIKFKQTIKPGDVGSDVLAVKRALKSLGHSGHVNLSRKMGPAAVDRLRTFQHAHSLRPDGIYGKSTHAKLSTHFDAYGRWLYNHAKTRQRHGSQIPPLPKVWPISVFRIDNGGFKGKWGLHPAIVPQVEAICKKFNLRVTSGYGGHPPHAYLSDHRVGLAVDLAGSYDGMVRCNRWADGLRGHTFRWVGGPAHDADGVEPGHYNHVHLSWYRTHPTTIFGTSEFK